tara:strand:+ start:4992 stop:5183 length:192 start_codon:yes stop_codon:yes gene_type:complete
MKQLVINMLLGNRQFMAEMIVMVLTEMAKKSDNPLDDWLVELLTDDIEEFVENADTRSSEGET